MTRLVVAHLDQLWTELADRKGKPSSEPETMKSVRLQLGKAWMEIETLPRAVESGSSQREASLEQENATLRSSLAHERNQHERTKAKIAKPPKPPLDPESEAAKQIARLKMRIRELRAERTHLKQV